MEGIQSDYAYRGDVSVPGMSEAQRDEIDVSTPGKGRWPRMLNLDKDVKVRLVIWLDEEIRRARMERGPIIDDFKQWQSDYWAKPETEVKNFPFRRAANVVVPLTAIAVEAVFARLFNTIFAVEPLWTIRPKTKLWVEAAKPVEKWLQTEVENENSLNAQHNIAQCLLELCKLGTFVIKSGYERDVRKSIKTLADGIEETNWVTIHDGATLDYVPLANFLMRIAEQDPQTAPWCGEEHSFTWGQLKRMALDGRIKPDALEAIKAYWHSQQVAESGSAKDYQKKVDDLANLEPVWHESFEVIEIWASFDVDKDGVDEEVVIDFHPESQTILSIRYNWYDDLHRPYRISKYIPVEGRLHGIGIGKQNEQFQQEVTTIHRQRLDNATLANMSMIKIKKTLNYGPGENIFPGKMWFVDEKDDIEELKLSEVYNSSYANEGTLVTYSEKRTGVSDIQLGVQEEGTPGTATDVLTRLAEGNKKFDMVLKNVRRALGLVGQDVLANYQQFGDAQRHWLVLDEQGQYVEQILQLPQQLVMHGAIVELTVTDSLTNRQVEQQQWMSLFQVIRSYFAERLNLAGVILEMTQQPEPFLQTIQAAITAGDEAYSRLLDTFGIVDKEALLPVPREAEGETQRRGQGEAQGLGPAPGMGRISTALERLASGRPGQTPSP